MRDQMILLNKELIKRREFECGWEGDLVFR
jgi:hypothetical protein